MASVEPVVFPNKQGYKLFGMYHKPDSIKDKGVCILLLSPGVKMRVAPHRLYNKMSEELVEMGFPVFRFDFYGLGDSEGEVTEAKLADFYTTVQMGRYIDDTKSAIDYMQNQFNHNKFILSGLCGGAITGLLTGPDDERIDALLGLGIPVALDGSQVDKAKYITSGQLKKLSKGYFRKIFNPKSLIRLLTFQSDYRVIGKVIKQAVFGDNKPEKAIKPKDITESSQQNKVQDNANPYFSPGFFKWMSASKRIMFIFSGADRLTWEFDEKFVAKNKEKLSQYSHLYDVHTVKNANHIFSFPEWYEEMMAITKTWLERSY